MTHLWKLLPCFVILPTLVSCGTSGGSRSAQVAQTTGTANGPEVLVELFMDTRPYPEQKGSSESSLTIETRDRDFRLKPQAFVDDVLKTTLRQKGFRIAERGSGRVPLILSGEIRHFFGQIQLTRLPGEKNRTTSSFLPANFHASVQLMATLFDVENQNILFRKSFLAARDERRSTNEMDAKQSRREIVRLVEECLEEATLQVAQEMETALQGSSGTEFRRVPK
jgi:hypothetical protein